MTVNLFTVQKGSREHQYRILRGHHLHFESHVYATYTNQGSMCPFNSATIHPQGDLKRERTIDGIRR
jgi:hypothetical protein